MILLESITHDAINPALGMLPPAMDTPAARVMLLAIGLQESRFMHRRQLVGNPPKPIGPAKGFWQFEEGGGVKGVITHKASRALAAQVAEYRRVPFMRRAIWDALEHDDILAAAIARLLLWTDPFRLPAVDNADGAWELYLRTWRPGKPHPDTWPEFHAQARAQVTDPIT